MPPPSSAALRSQRRNPPSRDDIMALDGAVNEAMSERDSALKAWRKAADGEYSSLAVVLWSKRADNRERPLTA